MAQNFQDYLTVQILRLELFGAFICYHITGENDCSQGPHLHFSLTDWEGRPMSINKMVVSGFKIKTGSKPYNEDCAEGSCKPSMTKQEVEESCSTIFSKIGEDGIEDDDRRFCPTITANIGI